MRPEPGADRPPLDDDRYVTRKASTRNDEPDYEATTANHVPNVAPRRESILFDPDEMDRAARIHGRRS